MDNPRVRPSVWMQDLTWQEVEERIQWDRIVFVPVGSTAPIGRQA